MSIETRSQNRRSSVILSRLALFIVLSVVLASPGFSQPRDSVVADKLVKERLAKVRADSLNSELRYDLANALHDAGKKQEALLQYDKAISIKPDHLEALVNKGVVLNELGKIEEAVASFERALSVNPRDPKALLNLGNSLYALQRYDDAMARYKLAAASDTTFVEAYYYIGIAFADAGIYREAIREWQKILEISPNSEVARNAKDNIAVLMTFLSGK